MRCNMSSCTLTLSSCVALCHSCVELMELISDYVVAYESSRSPPRELLRMDLSVVYDPSDDMGRLLQLHNSQIGLSFLHMAKCG
ncbi:hypothetical protein L1987_32706 [Smallanthus sonchifolius]|uniref:Uncharacterized protein n=1 Tax=Smallanthus sonchifolius TaxID=185202 RepID=A0ACB9HNZ7_9ASTR|nr:hypothetical protein L1987_32706 [Smallanthus sonchifolius]